MSKNKHPVFKFIMFTAGTAAAIHCINRYITKMSITKEKLKVGKGSYYNWKYGNIYYTKKGNGEPLLLIHDLSPFGSSYEWESIIHTLAKDYTVYSLDLLGCGRSDKPAMIYSNFLYVQLINNFIKDIIGEKTNIIANGQSAPLAVMSCTYNADLFNKIILVNPTNINDVNRIPTCKSKIAKAILDLPLLGTLLYYMITSRNNTDILLSEKYYYNPFRVSENMIDTYYESAHLGGGKGKYLLSSITGNYLNANITHGLKSIKNNILLIGGKNQSNIEEILENYKTINSSIKSSLLNNSRFLPHVEVPDFFLAAVKHYLENRE